MRLNYRMETEWFDNPQWWFGCTPDVDQYLSDKYGSLLDQNNKSLNPIDQILVYDQLPRHVFRGQSANHIVCYFLQKALNVKIDYESIQDDDRFCFAVLPLRHSGIYNNVYKAMRLTWQRIQIYDSLILRKFLRATYMKCPLMPATLGAPVTGFNRGILFFNPTKDPLPPYNFADLPGNETRKIILSISGGVDSMICSWLFVNRFDRSQIIGLHINYGNRETADEEEKFVKWWCSQLGIVCYVRKIYEIARSPCMRHGLRDVYETYTRNVRYNCYKQFGPDCVVVLGHNKDDVLENIFTNIAQKTKYAYLDGMTTHSVQDGILFWRPLLHRSKLDISLFAHEYNIPYLPNSTPIWSKRGQIRCNLVPVLNKWDSEFCQSLYALSNTMKDLYAMNVEKVEEFIGGGDGMVFPFEKLNVTGIFWREVFTRLDIVVSDKSLKNFLDRIKMTGDSCQIVLSKSCRVKVCMGKKRSIMIEKRT